MYIYDVQKSLSQYVSWASDIDVSSWVSHIPWKSATERSELVPHLPFPNLFFLLGPLNNSHPVGKNAGILLDTKLKYYIYTRCITNKIAHGLRLHSVLWTILCIIYFQREMRKRKCGGSINFWKPPQFFCLKPIDKTQHIFYSFIAVV